MELKKLLSGYMDYVCIDESMSVKQWTGNKPPTTPALI